MTAPIFFGLRVVTLISLFAGLVHANPMLFGLNSGGVGGASITSSGNWTSPGVNQTLTVPSGNPGVVKFTNVVADNSARYSKNNAAYVVFVSNDTLAVTNGDTLKFTETLGGSMSCTVIDNSTTGTVGSVAF